jgi:hypothetical protein
VAEIRRAVGQQPTRNLERAAEEIRDRRAARQRQELDPQKILEEAAKPELVVETANLPAAAAAVRDLFEADGGYYEWGIPAKVVTSSEGGLPQIVPLTIDAIVNEVHRLCRPVKLTRPASALNARCRTGWRNNISRRKASGSCPD